MHRCYLTPLLLLALLTLLPLVLDRFVQPTQAQGLQDDWHFEDETVESGTYLARQSVTAEDAALGPGAEVVFEASQEIRLLPGFRAGAGTSFRASIDTSLQALAGSCPVFTPSLDPCPAGEICHVPPNVPPSCLGDYGDRPRPRLSIIGFDSHSLRSTPA